MRVVIEEVMREELDQFLGVAWAESSPKRKGYRNGSYTRDLITSTGRLDNIKVPRDREGQFHTQTFEHYNRYEPHIAEGLTNMLRSSLLLEFKILICLIGFLPNIYMLLCHNIQTLLCYNILISGYP